ncbi:hypothetical protein BDR22DRAFT_823597 [Usnea florida]
MLLSLPAELIVEIFDKAGSFKTALALSHTCHRLRTMWKANANTILPSVVECFPQALALTQTEDMYRTGENVRTQEIFRSQQTVPVLHPERIERNAIFVSRILRYYERNIINAFALRGIKRDALPTDDRMDLLRAIYRAMTLAAAGKEDCTSHPLLASLDVREFKQMGDAVEFLESWFKEDHRQLLGSGNFDTMKEYLNRGDAFRHPPYIEVSTKLTILETDLILLTVRDTYYTYSPRGYHTIMDGDSKGARSGRGVLMGELLQRLEEDKRSRGV